MGEREVGVAIVGQHEGSLWLWECSLSFVADASCILIYLNLTVPVWCGCCYSSHFTNGTAMDRISFTWPRLHTTKCYRWDSKNLNSLYFYAAFIREQDDGHKSKYSILVIIKLQI